MKTKLAVIATKFLQDFVSRVMEEMSDEIDYELYFYSDFEEVLDIYRSVPKQVRGVVLSGGHPEHIIQSAYPHDGRVRKAFINDPAAIYKLFLDLFREFPGLSADRIYVDVFDLVNLKVEDYLYGDDVVELDSDIAEYFDGLPLQEMIDSEKELYKKHLRLWREGRIDVAVTRFSSLVGPLQERGVNVRFMYPSRQYLKNICREVAEQVAIAGMQANRPAVALITARDSETPGRHLPQCQMDVLEKQLQSYIKKFDPGAVLTPAAFGYEIVSSWHTVENLSGGFIRSPIQDWLRENIKFPISVGYGLGETLPQARLNAVDANREAMLHDDESYLVNSSNQLVGPLEKGRALVVSRKAPAQVQQMAAQTGLSSLTIQKVMAVAEDIPDGQITSHLLAQKLSITKRSANRFLSALFTSGYLEVSGMYRGTTKGRPERMYRFKLNS